MNWLDTNADGIAFAFWMAVLGLAWFLIACAVEWRQVRAMRRRAARREALNRYCAAIDEYSFLRTL